MEDPEEAILTIEIQDTSKWNLYWGSPRNAVLPPAGTSAGPTESGKSVGEKGRVIGSGSIAVSLLSRAPRNLWIDMTYGGGRVNIEAQFNEFVDPRFHDSIRL